MRPEPTVIKIQVKNGKLNKSSTITVKTNRVYMGSKGAIVRPYAKTDFDFAIVYADSDFYVVPVDVFAAFKGEMRVNPTSTYYENWVALEDWQSGNAADC